MMISCKETSDDNKIVFVQNQQVIDSFQMTKDLMENFEKDRELLEKDKENIQSQLKDLAQKNNTEGKFQGQNLELQNAYTIARQKINEIDQQIISLEGQVHAQVTKRLDEYIKLYAQKKSIDMIVGANGNGSLLYGKEERDITHDLIEFVNKKYEGE